MDRVDFQEQEDVFFKEVLEKKVKNPDGEEKKISDIIDVRKHIWEANGKIIFKHEAVLRLAHYVGAKLLEPKLIVEPSTMNGQAYVFLCSIEFPNGEISTQIGESNQYNTTSISRMYPASVAFKRGFDRAFLRSQFMNLFDVFSDVESDEFQNKEYKYIKNPEEVINGYAEFFKMKQHGQQPQNTSPNDKNDVHAQNKNSFDNKTSNTDEVPKKAGHQSVTEKLEPLDEIDALVNELKKGNEISDENPIKQDEQIEQNNLESETESEEDIMKKLTKDDSLLRLPENDKKYPGKHIVKDIIKKYRDFEYLSVIKTTYPNNRYYQEIIKKLKRAQ